MKGKPLSLQFKYLQWNCNANGKPLCNANAGAPVAFKTWCGHQYIGWA